MKPHPRIRKTIKWGGAAVTVLLVVVWIGSGWYSLAWRSKGGSCISANAGLGRVYLVAPWRTIQSGAPKGWHFAEQGSGFYWWRWRVRHDDFLHSMYVSFPMWVPIVLLGCVCSLAWRLDTLPRRRARLNLCPKCNYDRTGLAADAACPECGATIPSVK